MLDPMNWRGLDSVISLLELESGRMLYALRSGRIADQSGQPVARASLSARQAKALGLMTSGTFGQRSTISSASASLQSFLASRLEAVTALLGSTLYKLTWKDWTTPAGRSLRLLRASARRTSESDYIGLPTPTTRDHKDGSAGSCQNVPTSALLGREVHKIGLSTPKASDGAGGRTAKTKGGGERAPATRRETNGFWAGVKWLPGIDGRWRPTQPELQPVAYGVASRVGKLRAYGNAICAPQAQAFIKAAMGYRP